LKVPETSSTNAWHESKHPSWDTMNHPNAPSLSELQLASAELQKLTDTFFRAPPEIDVSKTTVTAAKIA